MIFQYSILQIFNITNIQYFQGWRTSRPDLPPHPSRNDQRSHSRHCFCHQPARKVGYCVLILILILILMRLLISTVGALRLPTTYDNHPIPSIHVSLWRQPLHRRSNRINLINLTMTTMTIQWLLRTFDLFFLMIIDLKRSITHIKRSIDRRWLFKSGATFILRWSCSWSLSYCSKQKPQKKQFYW